MVDIQLLNDDCWNVAVEVDGTRLPDDTRTGMDMQIISFFMCPLDKGDGDRQTLNDG